MLDVFSHTISEQTISDEDETSVDVLFACWARTGSTAGTRFGFFAKVIFIEGTFNEIEVLTSGSDVNGNESFVVN
jgi:hypothetical protein